MRREWSGRSVLTNGKRPNGLVLKEIVAASFIAFSPTRPYGARERPWLCLVTWLQNKINSEGGVLCLVRFHRSHNDCKTKIDFSA